MKTLILITAIPASGKSTWAKAYKDKHPNTYVVSSDETRFEVTGRYDDRSKQAEVWKLFSEKIHLYGKIDDVTVILDALNDLNSLRMKYVKENPEFDKYILVTFVNDKNKSRYFNSLRENNGIKIPEEALEELFNKFEPISEEVKELFDEIWEIRWRDKK